MKLYLKNGGADPCDVAQGCGGVLLNHNGRKIKGISIDSRKIEKDDMFVAIKGENSDGHDYISSAFSKGACCTLADHIPKNAVTGEEIKFDGKCIILCDDTVKSLGMLAHEYKSVIDPYTVGVTGSVGKTTTKEFISAVISEKFKTHKTSGNYNSEIGLPLTLLDLEEDDEALVVEMGMSELGEISNLSKIAAPDIAVITNIGSSHIERLGSRENICRAKLEIIDGLKQGGGLILNGDEPLLSGISGAFYIAFENENAQMRIKNVREKDGNTVFDLVSRNRAFEDITIPALGKHCAFDAAVGFTVGLILGMSEAEIRRGLMNYKSSGMRQNIYDIGSLTVMEDCYNASPESMKASLGVLSGLLKKKTPGVAVLGEMRELGEYSAKLHYEVGLEAAKSGVSGLITFGAQAEEIAKGAADGGLPWSDIVIIKSCDDVQMAADAVMDMTNGVGTVLFKASRAVKLERVIEVLKTSGRE